MKFFLVCHCIFVSVIAKPSPNNRIVRSDDMGSKTVQGTSESTSSQECKVGETFTRNHLKWKCQDGYNEPIACIGSDRIKNQEIPINSTKTIDGYWYKCQIVDKTVNYQEEPRCNVEGKYYHVNDTIKQSNLILVCKSNSITPIGCYFTDSKGTEVTTKIGETVKLDGVQHKCGGFSDGSSSASGSNKNNKTHIEDAATGAPACIDDGKSYKPGDKWEVKSGFIVTCSDDSVITISGCKTSSGATLKVGETKVADNYLHQCISDGNGGVRYSAQSCNKESVQCGGSKSGGSGGTHSSGQSVETKSSGQSVGGESVDTNTETSGQSVGMHANAGKQTVGNKTQMTIGSNGDDSSGTGSPACIHEGKTHKPGDKWDNKGFKFTCTSEGFVNITGCIVSADVTLPIGQSKIIDGYYHKCFRNEKGGYRYTAEPCQVSVICEGPNIGQSVEDSSASGQVSNVSNTQTGIHGGQGSAVGDNPKQCTKNGKTHQFNEQWTENGFKYVCKPNGSVNITACIADDGTEIPAGKTIVKGQLQHNCRYKPGGIIYEALVCGGNIKCGSNSTSTSTKMELHTGQAVEVAAHGDESPKKC